jgi:2'-5' RNA ligase
MLLLQRKEVKAMRLFIGIKTGCEDYLKSLQDALKKCGSGNFTHPDNLHLTLRFLGEAPPSRVKDISEAMRSAAGAPFELEIRGAKAFGRNGIVSAEVDGNLAPLSLLVSRLEQSLANAGFAREQRPYRPHITLAREFRATPCRDISAISHGSLRFTANEIILFESTRQAGRLTYVPLYTQKLK